MNIIMAVVGFLVGLLGMAALNRKKLSKSIDDAKVSRTKIIEDANVEADRIVKEALQEAKAEGKKRRKAFEEEAKKRRTEVNKLEKKIKQRENTIESKLESIEQQEQEIAAVEKRLSKDERRYHRLIAEAELSIEENQKRLEKVANMSAHEAKEELMKSLEEAAKRDAAKMVAKIEEETRKEASKKAKHIVSLAVQRIAGEYVGDSTVTVVTLPSEEMKGRIIGREGRNIRAIEQATGVDLIIDDTPEAVIISCFNPVRREVAKLTLERLIADGRIHPARIEETAQRVNEEFETIIRENGEQAAFDVGITDLHPELLAALGKLRYRSSGTQSILQHSIETARVAAMIAGELGENVKRAKRAGLLHDIGKALGQEVEGHHAKLGADFAKKYGEHREVVQAIALHHEENLDEANLLTVIVSSANVLSASRPGARKELLETYIKRLEDMEDLIKDHKGIESAFVLQSGREVRAMVTPDGVNDDDVVQISNDIASKLRNELTFPGQVRVTVLRESKFVEYAK